MLRPPVYPRWRGEHLTETAGGVSGFGLSPLARGTQKRVRAPPARPRFIPAGAGNTQREYEQQFQMPVYPRWRGEHGMMSRFGQHVGGLSPLARGTRQRVGYRGDILRFIPAGAGNTFAKTRLTCCVSVYPRWRGEHFFHTHKRCRNIGLSPLARGTLRR